LGVIYHQVSLLCSDVHRNLLFSPSFPLLPCAFIDIPSSFSVCKLSTLSRLVSGSSCVIIIFKNLAAAVAVAAAAAESVDGDGRTRLMEGRR
jgi:hypothetical protein